MELKPLADRLGLDLPEFIELVDLFVLTSRQDISRLERALQEQDPKGASAAAHSLKGSAGNLGFDSIAQEADHIEKKTRDGQISSVQAHLTELKKQLLSIKKPAIQQNP